MATMAGVMSFVDENEAVNCMLEIVCRDEIAMSITYVREYSGTTCRRRCTESWRLHSLRANLFHCFTCSGTTSFGWCVGFLFVFWWDGFVVGVVWLGDWYSSFLHLECTRSSLIPRLSPSS